MKDFITKVKELFLREKGIDIDSVDYMAMPERRENYEIAKTIGNVNLTEGRFLIKSEANVIVDEFLSIPLP